MIVNYHTIDQLYERRFYCSSYATGTKRGEEEGSGEKVPLDCILRFAREGRLF
jgi:hypothetical protein